MRAWRAAFLAGPALLVAVALLIPAFRSRPAGSPAAPAVPPLAKAGRLRVALERTDGGPPAFGPLSPAPDGVRLLAPPSWPSGASPRWELSSGTQAAFVVTVAPDGSLSSVAAVGAPTIPQDVMEMLTTLLRASRFAPYTAAEPVTVALLVGLPPSS